ncbi:MAG: hypothetical protein WBC07_05620 [Methylotenera sp.]
MANLAVTAGGALKYLVTQRAEKKATTSMKGISASSADREPSCGTKQSTRIVPSKNPTLKTSAK